MALLIEPRHYARLAKVLEQVFRLRRKVFVDRLGWALPGADGGLEMDAFDHGPGAYLAVLNEAGQVTATVRFTPSTEPNVSRDVLAPLMGVVLPAGPHIVEMSRMCADPALPREARGAAMLDLRLSTAALCLKRGWTHSIGVGYDHHIQPLIRSGMTVQILGPPVIFAGDREPSFAILATDPDRAGRLAGHERRLQDPAEDPGLLTRYGERAVA
jgi:N-acyl-L-homoserine lactone synthetase